jgi:hypothetical protein
VEQLLAMEVELRAIVIVACAHETPLPESQFVDQLG